MFSKKPSELKKLDDLFTEHSTFLEKRRELYLESQQVSRLSKISQSRNLESLLTDFDEELSQKKLNILDNSLQKLESSEKDTSNAKQSHLTLLDQANIPKNVAPSMLDREMIALSSLSLMEEEETKEGPKKEKKKVKVDPQTRKKMREYAKTFSCAEYMFCVPSDLTPSDWLIVPRPDGIRCLIITKKGSSYLINKNGVIVKCFRCDFPGGNTKNKRGTAILEGIFDKTRKICYLMDILFWNGQSFEECSTEMRYFWLDSHAASLDQSDNKDICFKTIPRFPCTSDGFLTVYQNNFDFIKNGLLFISKKGPYISGVNPYFLIWKDPGCCFYLYDNNQMSESFPAFLKLTRLGDLVTQDGFILAKISSEEAEKSGFKSGDLIKVEIYENDLDELKFNQGGNLCLLKNLKIKGKAGARRVLADSMSKILFSYHITNRPLTMSQICEFLKKV